MKLKNIIPILFSVVVGVSFAFFMFYQYDEKEEIQLVGKEETVQNVYFLQQGVYSSEESMKKNTTDFQDYIYEVKEGKYYVYVGMTKLEENAEKIKEYYKKKGYVLYRKELPIRGTNFLNSLNEYDELLKNTEDEKACLNICKQVLNQYKELVLNGTNENEGTT